MKVISDAKKGTTRLQVKEDKKYGIVNFGETNIYPQEIILLTNSSPTAKACINTYGRFIGGAGFKDLTFYKTIINNLGQDNDKILSLVKNDLSRCRGFAIHLNVSGAGKVTEYYHVPFEHVRRATKKKKEETGFDFVIYDNWDKSKETSLKPEEFVWIHKTSKDPAIIAEQVEQAEGWEHYKGQLIYYSADEGGYPLASCDAVLESIFAEIQGDITTTSSIEENFTAKGMIIHKGKFADDEEKEEFENNVEDFIGPEGASIIVVDVDKDEDAPEFVKIDMTATDKTLEYTDKKVKNKIINNYLIPKILLSITEEGGGYFNQEQIKDATMFYNMMTTEERLILETIFKYLGENFERNINASGDYTIAEIEFKLNKAEPPAGMLDLINNKEVPVAVKRATLIHLYGADKETAIELVPDAVEGEDKRLLIDVIGIGGTAALQAILTDPVMTPDQKKNSLVIIFGLSEDDAVKLSGLTLTTP